MQKKLIDLIKPRKSFTTIYLQSSRYSGMERLPVLEVSAFSNISDRAETNETNETDENQKKKINFLQRWFKTLWYDMMYQRSNVPTWSFDSLFLVSNPYTLSTFIY